MAFEPLKGKRVLLGPPGVIAVRLPPDLWPTYQRLHASYAAYLVGLPMLARRDFDGKRAVRMSSAQLNALNQAFARELGDTDAEPLTVFEAQEEGRTTLFKRLQFLS
jgi:hypothetical protein